MHFGRHTKELGVTNLDPIISIKANTPLASTHTDVYLASIKKIKTYILHSQSGSNNTTYINASVFD
jgi:hypothetical protein